MEATLRDLPAQWYQSLSSELESWRACHHLQLQAEKQHQTLTADSKRFTMVKCQWLEDWEMLPCQVHTISSSPGSHCGTSVSCNTHNTNGANMENVKNGRARASHLKWFVCTVLKGIKQNVWKGEGAKKKKYKCWNVFIYRFHNIL